MALKRPSSGRPTGSSVLASYGPGVWSVYPCLWEFLVSVEYEDGGRRVLPTLMVFLHDGRLTAALNDRDAGQTLFVSSDLPETLLGALEAKLATGEGEWRPNKPQGQRKKS